MAKQWQGQDERGKGIEQQRVAVISKGMATQ